MSELKKILFRADAGKKVGFGHFIRSLALAEYLKDYFECIFYSFNHSELSLSEYQKNEISSICSFKDLRADNIDHYNDLFVKEIKGNEIVVLDNYYFSTDYQNKIKKKGSYLVCIDNIYNIKMECDLFLTASNRPREYFNLPPNAYFINGIEHAFLRDPFLQNFSEYNKGNSEIKNIVLAMGGSDPYNLTNKIIKSLLKLKGFKINVIAGDLVFIEEEFKKKIKIHNNLTASEIVKLFRCSDLAILSASTISLEAIACKLPVLAGWYVDNQKNYYDFGVKNRLFTPLGNLLDNEEILEERLFKAITDFHPFYVNIDFNKGKKDIIKAFLNISCK